MTHPDLRVRLVAMGIIEEITTNNNRADLDAYFGVTWYNLLFLVRNSKEDQGLRDEAIIQLLRGSKANEVCSTLQGMGPNGQFAIPILAQFLADRQEEHWRIPSSATDIVCVPRLLAAWGPAAKAATPALLDLAGSSLHQSTLAPTAARALHAIDRNAGGYALAAKEPKKPTDPNWQPIPDDVISPVQLDPNYTKTPPEPLKKDSIGSAPTLPDKEASEDPSKETSPAELPRPRLVLVSEQIVQYGGRDFREYVVKVENHEDYSDELFVSSPDLPPIGRNKSASRTTVTIFAASGHFLYGHVALRTAARLEQFRFTLKPGTRRPEGLILELHDRLTNQRARSNILHFEDYKGFQE